MTAFRLYAYFDFFHMENLFTKCAVKPLSLGMGI